MKRVKRAIRQYEKKILDLENVVGVGSGYKIIRGKATDEPAVIVLVKEKVLMHNYCGTT